MEEGEESAKNILSLPDKSLIHIFKHLGVKDLKSCSAVCTKFRSIQNRNEVWRVKCVEMYGENASTYMITAKSDLGPESAMPDDLDDQCNWKKNYMNLYHLRRNWETKRFLVETAPVGVYVHRTTTNILVAEGDMLLVLIDATEARICAIFRTTGPLVIRGFINLMLDTGPYKIHLVNELIIIVQNVMLQVFKYRKPIGLRLLYKRMLDRDANYPMDFGESINDWFRQHNRTPRTIETCFSQNYLICLIRNGSVNKLYTWELTTGRRVHEQDVMQVTDMEGPMPNYCDVQLIPPTTHSGELIIRFDTGRHIDDQQNISNTQIINIYNFKHPDYRHVMSFTGVVFVKFEQHRIVVLPIAPARNVLFVYDCSARVPKGKSRLIAEADRDNEIYTNVQLRGDLIAYILHHNCLQVADYNLNVIYSVNLAPRMASYMFGNYNTILICYETTGCDHNDIELHDYRTSNVVLYHSSFYQGIIVKAQPTKFFALDFRNEDPQNFANQIFMFRFW